MHTFSVRRFELEELLGNYVKPRFSSGDRERLERIASNFAPETVDFLRKLAEPLPTSGLLEKLEAEIAELRDGAAIYRKQAEEAAERDEYSHEASRCEAYADARDNAADRLTRLIDSGRSGSE